MDKIEGILREFDTLLVIYEIQWDPFNSTSLKYAEILRRTNRGD